ncbi:RNA ligase [Candidatus Micrarchaeota archaeon]|nr:RNA ligase [Candidatus Micrarchaeota archaeon]MBU1166359.1 RNA ligase [Candidatus Micrarchaeota archaeon]MBU1887196.1 RNA ligase [Candidatus Micrarchaeota archaeon]
MALIDVKIVRDALKQGKAERIKGGFDETKIEYIRFRSPHGGIGRGTVIAGKRVIWGFPHIKRIFTLEKGLKKNMTGGTIFAEEKIDGFNVRIASIDGSICAFSRGGFLDLFVTEKAREMKLERFFINNPNYIICGEMIGNTPHTDPTDKFDVKLFVFDIDTGDGSYLPCEKKYSLLNKYSLQSVPVLGKFMADDYAGLHKLAISLNKGMKEGMVLKSADRRNVLKYVMPNADLDDISKTSSLLFDMPIGFFYQRVLRSAFFINDFDLDKDKYAAMLGRAFYSGLSKSIRKVKRGEEIDDEFEILIKDLRIWDDIKHNMGKAVKLDLLWKRSEKGKTRIRFRKIYRNTTKKLTSFASGKGVTD